jgi:hypothetical protein
MPFVDVGNEEITQVGGWNDTDLEDAIDYVRQNLTLPASVLSQLQFATAETYEAQYINLRNGSGGVDSSYNPSHAQYYIATNLGNSSEVGVIFANIFAYWDGISVSNAAGYVGQIYQTLEALYPNKEIVISETGWPSSGDTQFSPVFTDPPQSSVPSLANEQTFWQNFLPIANEQNIPFSAFEAYDEPNKGTATEDSWGLIVANSGPTYTSSTFKTAVTTLMPTNGPPPSGTTADLIMRDGGDGDYEIYDLGNSTILAADTLGPFGLGLQVAGVGGFDGADTSDVILRNNASGAFEVYDISDNAITSAAPMGQVGLEWSVAGFGDFSTRANETDMLMRNNNTGAFELYDIRNNTITSAAPMGQVGLEWQVAGFGDFSGNANETDMLLRDSYTGGFEVYDIVNNAITAAASMGQVGLEWQVAGFGNFSGSADETNVLMRDINNGAFEVYDIRNNQITSAASMGQVGTEWQVGGLASATSQSVQAMASFGAPEDVLDTSSPLGQPNTMLAPGIPFAATGQIHPV